VRHHQGRQSSHTATTRRQRRHLSCLALAFTLFAGTAQAEVAYFSFVPTTGAQFGDWTRYTINPHEFVFGVTDPETIDRLRGVVTGASGTRGSERVTGTIVRGREWYNAEWPYHFEPSTVRLSKDVDIEVCDATPFYIEENLHLVGGDFLPAGFWCPWSVRLVREVSIAPPPDTPMR